MQESAAIAVIGAVIGIISALSGVVLGWMGNARAAKKQMKKEVKEETAVGVQLRSDVEYIKRGVDDIRADVRAQGQRVDDLCDRVARVEESTKSAHKRIDEIIERAR